MADYWGLEKPDWGDQSIAGCLNSKKGTYVHRDVKTKSAQYTTPSTQIGQIVDARWGNPSMRAGISSDGTFYLTNPVGLKKKYGIPELWPGRGVYNGHI